MAFARLRVKGICFKISASCYEQVIERRNCILWVSYDAMKLMD